MERRRALTEAFGGPVRRRSLIVGLLVGSILNAINQGDAILAVLMGGDSGIVWWRIVLTYCVPYCVATYGAYSALRGEP